MPSLKDKFKQQEEERLAKLVEEAKAAEEAAEAKAEAEKVGVENKPLKKKKK